MNKPQLIDAIASESGLTKTDSKKALDAIIKAIGGSLAQRGFFMANNLYICSN